MTMYVYKIKDGISADSWDDVDIINDCIVCAIVEGENNKECEDKAIDAGYGDTDVYGWTYTNDIEIADDAERL